MPDLPEGASILVQGSAAQPYVLKNRGGVYSCSCPAWRNQSLPIDRRTCKHLRQYLGDEAETSRLGSALAGPSRPPRTPPIAPPLLLAETWDGRLDPTGWLLSEKLDGVRAWWSSGRFHSRQGNVYHAPAWFTQGLPDIKLDGELWVGRRQFQRTVSIVRCQDRPDPWREVRFVVFDAPSEGDPFETRLQRVREVLAVHTSPYALAHPHQVCTGFDHLRQELDRIEALGGEGLMLRQPGSPYVAGRSATLLKVKRFQDAEARVIGHQPGKGRHRGRLGALLVELPDGTRLAVGTGLSDAERADPPSVGSLIRFRYQELSEAGVPRFPSYVGPTDDTPLTTVLPKGAPNMTVTTSSRRRFEYVEGSSDKFWEINQSDTEVTVCFGRNGTAGQTLTKNFEDAVSAQKHVERLIRAKTNKGYREVG